MRKRRAIVVVFLGCAGVLGVLSLDWCALTRPALSAPVRIDGAYGVGPLRAGWGRAEIQAPWPLPLAGYGPGRLVGENAALPLEAQALVLEASPVRVAVVSLDLLLVPADLAETLRRRAQERGVAPLWVVATHTHSSMGGYDASLLSQVVGTGRYREEAKQALVDAAVQALERALSSVSPARLNEGTLADAGLAVGRDGNEPDGRLTYLEWVQASGAKAQMLVLGGHPTLAPRSGSSADPDYPGRLAALERPGHEVTLVLQGGSGNASAAVPEGEAPAPVRQAEAWRAVLKGLGTTALENPRLRFKRAEVSLPCPDAGRVVPVLFARAASSILCSWAPEKAELAVLEVGDVRLLFVPGEPTFASARALEASAEATRVVSLSGGYLGYVEQAERVGDGKGEARRQYFSPMLLPRLLEGAAVLRRVESLDPPPSP